MVIPRTPPCSIPPSLPSSHCWRPCTWTSNRCVLQFVLIDITTAKWCTRPWMTYERPRLTISWGKLATTVSRISNGKLVMFTPLVLRLSIATRRNTERRDVDVGDAWGGSRLGWCYCRGLRSWRRWWVGRVMLCRLLRERFLRFGDRGGRGKENWRVGDGTRTGAGRYLEIEHEHSPVDVWARKTKRRWFLISHTCLDQCVGQDDIKTCSLQPVILHFWGSCTK
jgi:hypothetical protein